MQTQKTSLRECHFIQVGDIDPVIEELKTSVGQLRIPADYEVKIYKSINDVIGCCGGLNSNLVVEIMGPEESRIKDIDLRLMCKLMEICQEKGLEYHMCDRVEIA